MPYSFIEGSPTGSRVLLPAQGLAIPEERYSSGGTSFSFTVSVDESFHYLIRIYPALTLSSDTAGVPTGRPIMWQPMAQMKPESSRAIAVATTVFRFPPLLRWR